MRIFARRAEKTRAKKGKLMFRCLTISAAALLFGINGAMAQVRVGLMVSATGPTTAIGIPQKNTGELLPRKIGDASVKYIQLDDGGDTTRAVQNAKKLIGEDHIDALIGPSTTPNALAILDIIAESKVPMLGTVGTSSVVEPIDAKRWWVFKTTQNDDLIAAALIKHMLKNGVKTVAFVGFNDPYGENWYKVFGSLAEKAGIRIVASERFARADQSVTGQVLKMMSAKPDAVLIAAAGAPPGCRRRRFTINPTRDASIRRMPSPPTNSSGSARKKSKGRCWRRDRCWLSTMSRQATRSGRWRLPTSAPTRSSSGSGARRSAPIPTMLDCCCSRLFRSRSRPPSREPKRSASRCATPWSSREISPDAKASST